MCYEELEVLNNLNNQIAYFLRLYIILQLIQWVNLKMIKGSLDLFLYKFHLVHTENGRWTGHPHKTCDITQTGRGMPITLTVKSLIQILIKVVSHGQTNDIGRFGYTVHCSTVSVN